MHEAKKFRDSNNKAIYKSMVIILVIIFTFIFTSFCVAFATPVLEKNDNKVVIGYPLEKLSNEVEANNTYTEYGYKYLEEIVKDSGWNYEVVVDTWENCIHGLRDGSIDVMGFVSKTDEREQFLEYAEISGGIVDTLLIAEKSNFEINYSELETMNGCRIGILKDTHLEILLDKFCKENNIHVEKIYYETERKMFNALSKGGIDLVFCTDLVTNIKTQMIMEISSDFFFFVVSKASDNCNEISKKISNATNGIFILHSDYNKTLLSEKTPKGELNHLTMVAAMEMENDSLEGWFYKKTNFLLTVSTVFFFLMFLIMVVYIKGRRNKEKAMYFNMVTKTWNFAKFSVEADKFLKRKNLFNNYAILHVNISKFRFLNDIYGFEVGNEVLCKVGHVLKKNRKSDELYASLWADHFVCLVQCDNEYKLEKRMKIILEDLKNEVKKICDARVVIRTGAYFITSEDIRTDKSTNNMLQYANHALSTIGEPYKNTLACYNKNMNNQIESLKLINKDMLKAFYNKEFVPYYQPKYNINTNEMIGAEALVRWIHPTKGIMYPSEFLPYFEKSGFIVEVDLYVFEQACKNMKKWREEGKKTIRISSNFSRLHCENKNFVQTVKKIAQKYQIPFHLLELELTETIVVEEMDKITKQIKELQNLGFSVSIDDFGSGYSSLSVLQQLKVDTIKLDKTFIENGIQDEREYKVMQAIVKLADQLQMNVICEGVETIEQIDLLKQVNCDCVQGYYFAKPMAADKLRNLLLTDK